MDIHGNPEHNDIFSNGANNAHGNPANANAFGNQPSDVWGNHLCESDPFDAPHTEATESAVDVGDTFQDYSATSIDDHIFNDCDHGFFHDSSNS